MAGWSRLLMLCLLLMIGFRPASAQDAPTDTACPGAPAPRLVVDGSGRVLPGDANNVRDEPSRDATLLGAIPGGAEFSVLEGPLCVDGLNWWRVKSADLSGWTVEGSGTEYWIEPLSPAISVSEWSNPYRNPQVPVANRLTVGAVVRVQTMNGDPLPVYATLDDTTPAQSLAVNTLVTLAEEGENGWWRIESDGDSLGWVREAVPRTGTAAGMSPTLAPVCPYTENRVLFLSYDSALGSNLYTVGRDGTHLCNLSYGLQKDFELYDWSPDGEWVAYSAVVDGIGQCAYGCSGELYVESVDGSVLRRLTFGQNTGHVQWSPDGAWIAVEMDGTEPKTRDIRLIAPDGSAERTLITAQGGFGFMRWSPDGTRMAVIETQQASGDFSSFIRVIHVETGDSQIIHESDWRIESLSWSPDGAFIAAATYIETGRTVLQEINIETGESEVVVFGETRSAVYSPDGTQIAFWRADLGAPRWVEVLDRASGKVTRLATLLGVNDRGLSWVPEGDAVLVGASGVMRVATADGALRSLFVGAFGSNWYAPMVQPSTD